MIIIGVTLAASLTVWAIARRPVSRPRVVDITSVLPRILRRRND